MDVDDIHIESNELLFNEGVTASTVVTTRWEEELRRSESWKNNLIRKETYELTDSQRSLLVHQLIGMKKGNKLPWGTQAKVLKDIRIHRSTICRLFNMAKKQLQMGQSLDVNRKRKGKVGRKPLRNSEEWLELAPLRLRNSCRSYGGAIKCSHTHLWRLIKKGILRAHTSTNHPDVLDKNKIERMKWVLQHIIHGNEQEKAKFVDMKHTVHIVEKWFFLNLGTRRLYMLLKEVDPHRTCKNNNFSVKVMFIAATSKPLYDPNEEMIHDGKFGIWPFVVKEQQK